MLTSFAMEGEDLILTSLLRNKIGKGSFLDIGCSDPVVYSNTYYFYRNGWRGIAVDGRDLSTEWARARPGDKFIRCLVGYKTELLDFWTFPDPTMNTADSQTAARYSSRFSATEVSRSRLAVRSAFDLWQELAAEARLPAIPPDIVSIDVEGFEIPVLMGILEPQEGWRPPILLVETKLFNFLSPFESEIFEYLVTKHAYAMVCKTPLNAFFIDPKNQLFEWIPAAMTRRTLA